MQTDYILTVIVPIRNTEQYVVRCIDSILNQSLKKIMVIAIDDASSDTSYQTLIKYQDYANVRILHNEQRIGQGATRNLGLRLVSTKYYCFLDSDDWVDSNAYKLAVNALENNDAITMAIFGVKTEFENSILSSTRYTYENNLISRDFALSLLSSENAQDCYISALLGNKVFRTGELSEIQFNDRFFEDAIYTYKAIQSAQKIILLSDTYLHYYQRQGSIMHSFSAEYIDDLIDEFLDLKEYMLKRHTPISLKQYYSYFDKCSTSMINVLFSTEQSVKMQKELLLHYIRSVAQKMSLEEIVDYLDINRIKQLFSL